MEFRARRQEKRARLRIHQRWWFWTAIVLGLVIFVGVWIGVRGLTAKGELEAAIPLAATAKSEVLAGGSAAAVASFQPLLGEGQGRDLFVCDGCGRGFAPSQVRDQFGLACAHAFDQLHLHLVDRPVHLQAIIGEREMHLPATQFFDQTFHHSAHSDSLCAIVAISAGMAGPVVAALAASMAAASSASVTA